jgi:hypothetical protein
MVALPEATPVTVKEVPVVPLMEATAALDVTQEFETAAEAEPVKAKVFPTATEDPPVMVGRAFTVAVTDPRGDVVVPHVFVAETKYVVLLEMERVV